MHLGLDDAQADLRDELRGYYASLLTPDVRAGLAATHGLGPVQRRIVRRMGADGWLGIGWPREYGGQGRTPIEQFVFYDESMRAGAPVPMLTVNTVGPTIFRHGTADLREAFLPRILRGEVHFCIGYTEPQAGTDLAALRTKAARDGDEYVVDGQKLFTSLAGGADYCWLAVRTDADAPRHKGISLLIVPMDAPGITVQPLNLLVDHDLNQVFFDGVRVPVGNRVGDENRGWSIITSQLNHERVTLCSSGLLEQVFDDTVTWARATRLADGRRVIDQEWVQLNLARVKAGLEFLRLVNWKVAWGATKGHPLDIGDASTIKVFGTEQYLDAFRLLMEVIGPRAALKEGSPEALDGSRLERYYRSLLPLTFAGGVNEVQRDLIAMFGLGFPRADR